MARLVFDMAVVLRSHHIVTILIHMVWIIYGILVSKYDSDIGLIHSFHKYNNLTAPLNTLYMYALKDNQFRLCTVQVHT